MSLVRAVAGKNIKNAVAHSTNTMEYKMKKIISLLFIGGLSFLPLILGGCSVKSTPTTDILTTITEPKTSTEEITGEETTQENEAYVVPNVPLTKLDDSTINLHEFKGKITIINIWATWCKFCRMEMPVLQKLHEEDDHVQLIMLNTGEDAKTISKYLKENEYTFTVFKDPASDFASLFEITSFPSTMFLGPNMEYYYLHPGAIDEDNLNKILGLIREDLDKKGIKY